MHEYTLMQEVVAALLEKLGEPGLCPEGAKMEVVLRVGALAVHSAAATRQAYEVLVQGTILENSSLNLIIEPLNLSCGQCGFKGPLPEGAVDPHDLLPLASCPTCGALGPIQAGRGVESLEVIC